MHLWYSYILNQSTSTKIFMDISTTDSLTDPYLARVKIGLVYHLSIAYLVAS